MNRSKLVLAVVFVVVGMAAVPSAASAATGLAVDVDQRPATGEAVVTVSENESIVENATVEVTSDSAYAGNGTYTTDADGEVVLPEPADAVTVMINASGNGTTVSQQVELLPREDALDVSVAQTDSGSATVSVTQYDQAIENATVEVSSESAYDGNGTYETDDDGEVVLPNPNETVSVTVEASANNATASESIELVPLAESLDVAIEQTDDGSATVTVTQYGEVVENATVNVTGEENYSAEGTYTTDENGTVTLDQPEDDQQVTVTASIEGASAETTAELTGYTQLEVSATQTDDGVLVSVTDGDEAVENATVEVEADGDYSGTGTYATDADGEVALPLPQENVTITVTASADGETATTTERLTVEFAQQGPFGQAVSSFVSALQSAGFDGPPGQIVSDFVTSNNPGNADEAPGNSGDAPGQETEDDDSENETSENETATSDAPGNSGDAPGQPDEAPGNSGDAPGQAGDAPGQAGNAQGNGADDAGNAPGRSGDAPGQSAAANGNGPDDRGPDRDAETAEDESDEDDEADEEDEEDETETDTDDGDDADESDDDSADSSGNGNGNGNSGGAPGNSGDAPGQN